MKPLAFFFLVFALMQMFYRSESLFCKLPPPNDLNFTVSRGPFYWYEVYRFCHPLLDLTGRMTIYVEPIDNSNNVSLQANFTRNPQSIRGTGQTTGHQLCATYEGLLGPIISGIRNILFTDNKSFYIDHYCLTGIEVSTIFYYLPEIPPEKLEEIWSIIDNCGEVDRSRYRKIIP